MNTIPSLNLSITESNKSPYLDTLFVSLAIDPSIESSNAPIATMIPARKKSPLKIINDPIVVIKRPRIVTILGVNLKEIKNLAILFGREDRGLTNKELLMAHKVFTIKTHEKFPSLNLSHAVSSVLYELSKDTKAVNMQKKKELNPRLNPRSN